MNYAKQTGYATPFTGQQAPDHLALGFSTQLELEGEVKAYPFQKKMPFTKPRPSCKLDPLPQFPFGVVPIFPLQQNSDLRQRGFDGPKVVYDGSAMSADLADAYAQLENKGKRIPYPLSNEFQGSQWDYTPRTGRPFGTTDGSNFVLEYQSVLRQAELERRVANLLKDGYDAKRVARIMEEEVDNTIREKLRHR
jgi:hypothetical protein